MARDARRHGRLRQRMHFQRRRNVDDGFGNEIPGGEFQTELTLFADLTQRTSGSEIVTAARLDGRQPFVVTVRWTPGMDDVTTAWRLVDASKPNRILNIASPPVDPDGKRQWIEFLAVEGGQS